MCHLDLWFSGWAMRLFALLDVRTERDWLIKIQIQGIQGLIKSVEVKLQSVIISHSDLYLLWCQHIFCLGWEITQRLELRLKVRLRTVRFSLTLWISRYYLWITWIGKCYFVQLQVLNIKIVYLAFLIFIAKKKKTAQLVITGC